VKKKLLAVQRVTYKAIYTWGVNGSADNESSERRTHSRYDTIVKTQLIITKECPSVWTVYNVYIYHKYPQNIRGEN